MRMRGGRGALAAAVTATVAVAAGLWALRDIPASLGAAPSGARARRVRRSPQFDGEAFRNPVPGAVIPHGTGKRVLRQLLFDDDHRAPRGTVPVVRPSTGPAGPLTTGGLHVTWMGHSTALVEIEGRRVLFDPVWSDRCSPSALAGPRRVHPVPLPIERLPHIDAVVISHDHYDHLDRATVRTLTRTRSVPFLVPLGVGAHLERWGVPRSRIVELDWEEDATVGGLRFTATAARHFSGRAFARNQTLWSSWVVAGQRRRVFYTGDSGYFDGYAEIGRAHGPFDLTLIQIGAYSAAWPDIHMTPEEAVEAHLDLRGDVLLPVHWGTFKLSVHPWSEPVDRLWTEAKARDVRLVVPRPGERISADDPPPVDGWWQTLA
ncbi:Zn-dependent hydrolase [Microtetraspora sp. NBRC 13810]|uniref:MBL fold metallo-hydrolase n=1 Tax=Microtetraspora sp. NBRC 13810 TaxID=3030990 RepID=UPI0024A1AADD|nr:MBL fold metallo-hydrolase [Microtetraspora sp. NBRC 13810]GLW10951.1 Zn-dependent hydrolase [Microtetraspora sp. NBRC 13810]